MKTKSVQDIRLCMEIKTKCDRCIYFNKSTNVILNTYALTLTKRHLLTIVTARRRRCTKYSFLNIEFCSMLIACVGRTVRGRGWGFTLNCYAQPQTISVPEQGKSISLPKYMLEGRQRDPWPWTQSFPHSQKAPAKIPTDKISSKLTRDALKITQNVPHFPEPPAWEGLKAPPDP